MEYGPLEEYENAGRRLEERLRVFLHEDMHAMERTDALGALEELRTGQRALRLQMSAGAEPGKVLKDWREVLKKYLAKERLIAWSCYLRSIEEGTPLPEDVAFPPMSGEDHGVVLGIIQKEYKIIRSQGGNAEMREKAARALENVTRDFERLPEIGGDNASMRRDAVVAKHWVQHLYAVRKYHEQFGKDVAGLTGFGGDYE